MKKIPAGTRVRVTLLHDFFFGHVRGYVRKHGMAMPPRSPAADPGLRTWLRVEDTHGDFHICHRNSVEPSNAHDRGEHDDDAHGPAADCPDCRAIADAGY